MNEHASRYFLGRRGRHLSAAFIVASVGTVFLSSAVAVHANSAALLKFVARAGIASAVGPLVWLGANRHPYNAGDDSLWRATLSGHVQTVRALLNAGANVQADENRALRIAAEFGKIDIVKLLLDRGADLHARDNEALMRAAQRGHTEVVALLLDRGADIHAHSDDSLRWAAFFGNTDTLDLLLKRGADPHAVNDEALRIAKANGHSSAVKLLEPYPLPDMPGMERAIR